MQPISTLLSRWRASTAAMQKLTNQTPRIIGKECVGIVKDNFKLQGYDSGAGVSGWKSRLPATNRAYDARRGKGQQGKYKGSIYSSTNPLLLQTRNLYNALKYAAINKTVQIGVDLLLIPYAEAMNKTRKYMPTPEQKANAKMLKAINNKITFERDKAMKEFKK